MNTRWRLLVNCRGYRAGSIWTLIRVTQTGWEMEDPNGVRAHWSNVNLFAAA